MRLTGVIIFMVWVAGCSITPVPPVERGADVLNENLADGQPLAYRVLGMNGLTPPIVLLHGVADSSESWESIAGAFEQPERVAEGIRHFLME